MSDMYTWENVIFIPTSEAAKSAIGKECYFGDSPADCLKNASRDMFRGTLESINPESIFPFRRKNASSYGCIVLKRELSYTERAIKWIKDNDLKVGDYVRVTRKAGDYEDGWGGRWVGEMDDFVGKVIPVSVIGEARGVIISYCYYDQLGHSFPYFVLEKVEEPPKPQCVPFTSMEEFADAYETNAQGYDPGTFIDNLRCNGMWIRCKKDHGVYQVIGMLDNSVMIAGFKDKKTWKELFDEFEFLNNKPCGKEEE